MSIDCDDLGFPNQWEMPRVRPAPETAWTADAACRGKPHHWWFPDTEKVTSEAAEALAICETCPVREDCLNHALDNNETDGIWGGATEEARRRIRRRRGAA